MSINNRILASTSAGGGGFSTAIFFSTYQKLLWTADISDPSNMQILDEIDITSYYPELNFSFMAADPVTKVAYLPTFYGVHGLISIDVSDPTNISVLDTFSAGQAYTRFVVDSENQLLYAAAGNNDNYAIFDISDPTNMTKLSSIDVFGVGRWPVGFAVDIDNKIAFQGLNDASTSQDNISSVDFTNPSSPTILDQTRWGSSLSIEGRAAALNTTSNILYVAHKTSRVTRWNVTDPSNMSIIGEYYSTTYVNTPNDMKIDIDNQIVYITTNGGRLSSFDVSGGSFTLLNSIAGLNQASSLALDLVSKVAYVTPYSGNYYLHSIDISNPSSMSVIQSFSAPYFSGSDGVALL